MTGVFLKILNMSIVASWLALVVLAARFLLKKAPKCLTVLLWGMVAVRLVCPFSFESALSLLPSSETLPQAIVSGPDFDINSGIEPIDRQVNDYLGDRYFEGVTVPTGHGFNVMSTLSAVWATGVVLMTAYAVVSYSGLRRSVATAVKLRDNIYQSENVDSPFVLGLLRPRIYLPFGMDGQAAEQVTAHECAHISRRDHWWKPLGFLLLSLHWFNPLMWVCYVLLCRDIELACDQKVIKTLSNEQKADYTQALLACSVNRSVITACPLAFGEVGVKERVRSVMNYKKPAFWVVAAAILACIAVAVCFLTDPVMDRETDIVTGQAYWVTEVTYESGLTSYSMVAQSNTPEYMFDDSGHMFSVGEYTEAPDWTDLGQMSEISLTKDNFDRLFRDSRGVLWTGGISAPQIRRNTIQAWSIVYNNEKLYYILRQKNGELYIAYGYYDYAEKDDPYSDDTSIRWLYRVLPVDTQLRDSKICELLEIIQSSPLHSSNPGDYTDEHKEEYKELLSYGEYTLRYCFGEFMRGGQTDLRGHIMALACVDIMAEWGEGYAIDGIAMTGQDWFRQFEMNTRVLANQLTGQNMQKSYPGAYILYRMLKNDAESADGSGGVGIKVTSGTMCSGILPSQGYNTLNEYIIANRKYDTLKEYLNAKP